MADLSRGQTFGATETITNTKLHNLVDLGSVTNITNNDISNSANIADTKLGDITTGNKVGGTAMFGLASIPEGAGAVPAKNVSLASASNESLMPITLASWISGQAFKDLASTPTSIGQFPYQSIVSSLASGGVPSFNGSSALVGANINSLVTGLSNVIFSWNGTDDFSSGAYGFYTGTSLISTTPTGYSYMVVKGNSYQSVLRFKFTKISGISTATFYVRLWSNSTASNQEALCRVVIGGQSGSVQTTTSATPTWLSSTVDVSGLTNGTTYDATVDLRNEDINHSGLLSAVTIIAS